MIPLPSIRANASRCVYTRSVICSVVDVVALLGSGVILPCALRLLFASIRVESVGESVQIHFTPTHA